MAAQPTSDTPRAAAAPLPDLVEPGKVIYEENCADCHRADGTGDIEFGAPNLADAIWFYGDSEQEIAAQIANPKHGVMPGWVERLGEPAIKQLAVFVPQFPAHLLSERFA